MNIREILEDPRLDIPPATPSMVFQFKIYLDLLVKWNQKINLTSEKTPKEILERHIFDSLQYARFLFTEKKIADIGSGAGFPGLPLKIIYPDLRINLIDSQRKRCSFLEAAILKLGLKGTRVINERAEKILPLDLVGAVIFRSFSDINNCLQLASPFLITGGRVILKKQIKKINGIKNHKDPLPSGFSFKQERVVSGYNDKKSSLLIFEKRLS